jgi:hypothetical protein
MCRSVESSCAGAGSVESKCACAGSVEFKCANPKARALNCGTQEGLCPSVCTCQFSKSKRTCAGAVCTKCAGPWNSFYSARAGLWSSVSVRVRVCGAQYQCACGSVELSISARAGLWSSVAVRVRVCGAQYHKYLRRDSLRSSKSLFNKCGFPSRRKNLLVGLNSCFLQQFSGE